MAPAVYSATLKRSRPVIPKRKSIRKPFWKMPSSSPSPARPGEFRHGAKLSERDIMARNGGCSGSHLRPRRQIMRAIDENTITEDVVEQVSFTQDARLRKIMASLVRHLQAFAREVDLTPDEWLAGIRFLTEVGQKCTPFRQEFILLSDTLGLSSLVNALHDRRATGTCTKSSLLGPFYRHDAPAM